MLSTQEMAIMHWVPREPMDQPFTATILAGMAPASLSDPEHFDSVIAKYVIGNLAARKLITRVGEGYIRTREGQAAYRDSMEHYVRLARLFTHNEY